MRPATRYATPAVCASSGGLAGDIWLLTLLSGLYYKLHGVHRPMTMKKSIIKRRKRVIPATQGSPDPDDTSGPMESIETQTIRTEESPERGTMNPDGSVNLGSLGSRRRPDQHSLSLLPDPMNLSTQTSSPLHPAGLAAYHTSHAIHLQQIPNSLSDDNRLAPLTSIAAASDRQSSLSPASFLSPSRKRSFSTAETDTVSGGSDVGGHDTSKRLSSIKSILNPSGGEGPTRLPSYTPSRDDDYGDSTTLPPIQTPGTSPGTFSAAATPGSTGGGSSLGRDAHLEEASRAERRAALQREAERMRKLLAANERELAELEND